MGNVTSGRREQNKQRVRAAIRRAGVELIEKYGFQPVSVDDIVAAAGVSRSTFFNYFPSKEAVLTAAPPMVVERQRVLCAARPSDEPLWQSLSFVILDLLTASEQDLRILKRLKAASPELGDLLHKSNKAIVEELAAWATGRVRPEAEDDVHVLINVFLAAAETCLDQWSPDEPFAATVARLEGLFDRLGRSFNLDK